MSVISVRLRDGTEWTSPELTDADTDKQIEAIREALGGTEPPHGVGWLAALGKDILGARKIANRPAPALLIDSPLLKLS